MITARLHTVRQRMHESGIDSLLVSHPPNIQYLTGYPGDNAYAVVTGDDLFLFVFRLNSQLAHELTPGEVTVVTIENTVSTHFGSLGASFWGNRAGYEPEALTCESYRKIDIALEGITLVPSSGLVDDSRRTKDYSEIRAMERSQAITDQVFSEVLGLLREGVTERDIAAEIEYRFRLAGGDGAAFDTIVAFGAKSSMPHAVSDGATLSLGDIVLFDMGTVVDGYASDMTRTVVFGRATREMREWYRLVLDAQEAGITIIGPGKSCADAHRAALEVFESAGLEDAFLHSLGHGVGLEVHEAPVLSPRSTESFRTGDVVTVEPGLYFTGRGGIRIEDMLIVTSDGARNLTNTPKSLIEL